MHFSSGEILLWVNFELKSLLKSFVFLLHLLSICMSLLVIRCFSVRSGDVLFTIQFFVRQLMNSMHYLSSCRSSVNASIEDLAKAIRKIAEVKSVNTVFKRLDVLLGALITTVIHHRDVLSGMYTDR